MSLTHEIKTRVDEETGAALRRRAASAGCQVSELVRDAIYLMEHGMTFGEYVAKHRRMAIGLSVPIAGQQRADAGPEQGR